MPPDTAATIAAISDIANNLTVFSTLAIIIFTLARGYVVTQGHHVEIVAALNAQLAQKDQLYRDQLAEKAASEERAWAAADKAQAALVANNLVIDRAVDAIQGLTRLPAAGGGR